MQIAFACIAGERRRTFEIDAQWNRIIPGKNGVLSPRRAFSEAIAAYGKFFSTPVTIED